MAKKSDTDSGEGWWGSWIQAAKNKSNNALEFFKRDLTEFGLTVQTNTSQAVSCTSSTLKETLKTENTVTATAKIKDSLSNLLEKVTNALTIQPEDKDDVKLTSTEITNLFDHSKARLHAIQVDPGTYCCSPSGPHERYEEWLKAFDLENRKSYISELLVSNVEVRSLYTSLVPLEVSHGEFWQHYFYKVHQLQLDEARKLVMMKRTEAVDTKDTISWDEDWIGDEEVKGTAEERLKLPVEDIEDYTVVESEDKPEQNDHEIECSDKETDTGGDGRKNDDRSSPGSRATDSVIKTDLEAMNTPEHNSDTDDNSEMKEMAIGEDKAEYSVEQPVVCTAFDSSPNKDGIETEISVFSDNVNADVEQLNTKVKGDMVVVNPDRDSPSSESSGAREVSSVSEDWEQDFDVDLTEEDLAAVEEIVKKMNSSDNDYSTITGNLGEDWENWK